MTDPSVLPATIMQTTSALIGIYLAVFVLAFPIFLGLRKHFSSMAMEFDYGNISGSISKSEIIRRTISEIIRRTINKFKNIRKENPDINVWKLRIIFILYSHILSGIISLFLISFILGCFTIYGSMLWLECLTTDTTNITAIGYDLFHNEPLQVYRLAIIVQDFFSLTLFFIGVYTLYIVGLLIFLSGKEIKLPPTKVEIK
jgi:hypothetical protein